MLPLEVGFELVNESDYKFASVTNINVIIAPGKCSIFSDDHSALSRTTISCSTEMTLR